MEVRDLIMVIISARPFVIAKRGTEQTTSETPITFSAAEIAQPLA